MFEECIRQSKPLPDFAGTDEYQVALTLRGEIQDPVFLRFVERHGLKPGQVVSVVARDEVADAVQLCGADDTTFTLGARAASKLLVDVTPEAAAAATPPAGRNAAPRR